MKMGHLLGTALWQYNLNRASRLDDYNLVGELLSVSSIHEDISYFVMVETAFSIACAHGSINTVSFMISHPQLNGHINVNRLFEVDFYLELYSTPFIKACEGGHLNVVRLLLNSDFIYCKPDISILSYDAIMLPVQRNFNHIVFYLFDNFLTGEIYDFNILLKIFKLSFYNGNVDMIEYLIFELNLEFTESIAQLLFDYNHLPAYNQAKSMFISRELKNNLTKDLALALRNFDNKKTKI